MSGLLSRLERRVRPLPESEQNDTQPLPIFSDSFITDMVFASDDIPEEARINREYIHVSSLIEFCARRQILALRDGVNLIKQPRAQDRVMWAMGKAAENHIRLQLLRRLNYSGVVGDWECRCGELKYSGVHDRIRICRRCQAMATVYHEFTAIDTEYKIIGHPDFLFFYRRELVTLEVKSMKKEDYVALQKPLANHIFQAGAYRRILESRKTVDIKKEVIIVYVCKDWVYKGLPYKEFHVDVTIAPWCGVLDVAWVNAGDVRQAQIEGTLPQRLKACPTHTTPMARNCLTCTSCFSRRN